MYMIQRADRLSIREGDYIFPLNKKLYIFFTLEIGNFSSNNTNISC
jgi:hypothetical protein